LDAYSQVDEPNSITVLWKGQNEQVQILQHGAPRLNRRGRRGKSYDLKELLQEKFQLAEIFEGAAYAAEKCPGLRVIEDNVMATADEAGVTDEIYTPEWRFWESRGQMKARMGYEKNPTAWCESMWHFLSIIRG
jgi:hypothetical protein